jgi:transposase
MAKKRLRAFSRTFKLAAVRRMMAGANVAGLARELKVLRKDLYCWRARFREGGPEALRGHGRPRKSAAMPARPTEPLGELEAARARITELECKIGQQQVDIDFFRQALRQVGEGRRQSVALGAPRSTRSSKR